MTVGLRYGIEGPHRRYLALFRRALGWLAVLGSLAVSGPGGVYAQTDHATPAARTYRIGIINYAGVGGARIVKGALEKMGYREGVNTVYEERVGNRDITVMPRIAEELVAWKPDVIISLMTNAHVAIQKATEHDQIPIVFWSADPLETGVIKGFRHSGTNFTGFSYEPYVQVLQLRLLKLAVPNIKCVGHLYNPTYAPAPATLRELEMAGKLMNVAIKVHETLRLEDFEKSIAAMRAEGCDGFVVGPHELFNGNGARIGALALKYRLAAVSIQDSITAGGGLATYGPPFEAGWTAMAPVIDRILQKGAKPSDIPIERSFKSPLTINLKAAKALGLTLPPTLIEEADRLIE